MTAIVDSLGRRADDVVSPELVLVDPSLAELERTRAPVPQRVPRLTFSPREVVTATGPGASRPDPHARVPARTRRSRSRRALFAAAIVLITGLVLFGLSGELGDRPTPTQSSRTTEQAPGSRAAAPRPAAPRPAAPRPAAPRPAAPRPAAPRPAAPRPSTKTSATRARPRPRRFAWAPVKGADGYHVELFLGSRRVFAVNARGPTVTVPAGWRYEGKPHTLTPGEYRWYVWPIVAGARAPHAIVQAKLSVTKA